MESNYVCEICGLPVRLWTYGWKHSAGGRSLSCGRPPRVIERARYEADLAAIVSQVGRPGVEPGTSPS